jgi:hypothetical protein
VTEPVQSRIPELRVNNSGERTRNRGESWDLSPRSQITPEDTGQKTQLRNR